MTTRIQAADFQCVKEAKQIAKAQLIKYNELMADKDDQLIIVHGHLMALNGFYAGLEFAGAETGWEWRYSETIYWLQRGPEAGEQIKYFLRTNGELVTANDAKRSRKRR